MRADSKPLPRSSRVLSRLPAPGRAPPLRGWLLVALVLVASSARWAQAEPFLAEIRPVAFGFCPAGWAELDGQILPINQNQSLYSLLGTTYGGDGETSFALPDMRGRVAIHVGRVDLGADRTLGQKGGEETHTLSVGEIPGHGHGVPQWVPVALRRDTGLVPRLPGDTRPRVARRVGLPALLSTGGGQAHDNMMPYQVIRYCIARQGLFPSM